MTPSLLPSPPASLPVDDHHPRSPAAAVHELPSGAQQYFRPGISWSGGELELLEQLQLAGALVCSVDLEVALKLAQQEQQASSGVEDAVSGTGPGSHLGPPHQAQAGLAPSLGSGWRHSDTVL